MWISPHKPFTGGGERYIGVAHRVEDVRKWHSSYEGFEQFWPSIHHRTPEKPSSGPTFH
jgi:hypothetical protein